MIEAKKEEGFRVTFKEGVWRRRRIAGSKASLVVAVRRRGLTGDEAAGGLSLSHRKMMVSGRGRKG